MARPSILAEISTILDSARLTILSASTSEEAIQISATFAGNIDLLLTEVMMPGMSGPDLARMLTVQRTNLRVMMITSYAGGDLLILNYGWHMVKQQSVAKIVSEKVQEILNSPDRSQGADQFNTKKDLQ